MKKKLLVIAVVILILICTGCSKDPVKTDLESYIAFEMSVEKETQGFSLEFMASISNASTKEETLKILGDGIDKLLTIAEKQKKYKPETEEVQNIHDKNIRILDTNLVTLQETIQLLNSNKSPQEQLNNLNKRQQQIKKVTKEYKKAINTLAEQKKVEVKLKFE